MRRVLRRARLEIRCPPARELKLSSACGQSLGAPGMRRTNPTTRARARWTAIAPAHPCVRPVGVSKKARTAGFWLEPKPLPPLRASVPPARAHACGDGGRTAAHPSAASSRGPPAAARSTHPLTAREHLLPPPGARAALLRQAGARAVLWPEVGGRHSPTHASSSRGATSCGTSADADFPRGSRLELGTLQRRIPNLVLPNRPHRIRAPTGALASGTAPRSRPGN